MMMARKVLKRMTVNSKKYNFRKVSITAMVSNYQLRI
jgi:hypothetical protein